MMSDGSGRRRESTEGAPRWWSALEAINVFKAPAEWRSGNTASYATAMANSGSASYCFPAT